MPLSKFKASCCTNLLNCVLANGATAQKNFVRRAVVPAGADHQATVTFMHKVTAVHCFRAKKRERVIISNHIAKMT